MRWYWQTDNDTDSLSNKRGDNSIHLTSCFYLYPLDFRQSFWHGQISLYSVPEYGTQSVIQFGLNVLYGNYIIWAKLCIHLSIPFLAWSPFATIKAFWEGFALDVKVNLWGFCAHSVIRALLSPHSSSSQRSSVGLRLGLCRPLRFYPGEPCLHVTLFVHKGIVKLNHILAL